MAQSEYRIHLTKRGWTWKLIGGNGEIVSKAGEPFFSKSNAKRAAKRHQYIAASAVFK